MATEIVKTIKVETVGADKSVKSLRDNIKQLRNDLLNLDKGTQEYDNTLNQIIKDETELTQVMRAGKDEVAQALKKVTGEYVTQKQELKALKVELEQLEPGTDAYNEKFARAAEITANLKQQQELLKYASNDLGDQLSNMRGIMANVAAGFSAAQAAIGLFGGESKEVQQAMLKVQQAMALVQGLEGLDGFIKRTKGLSAAIQGWVTQSKAATVQTTAQATATKAAATATNAETVATQGATVAQKGLNAAMKANPVGIVVAALALLVANWKKVVEWIGKAVGGFDKLKKSMNKFKATVSGVGNAIKKVLIVPIKEAINYVTTLGKVLWDALTLNWGEIKEDIKNGIDGAIGIVKDGYNVAANYAKGKEEEITRQQKEEARKRAEERADELDKIIQLKEAQNDADWKFSEEGQAVYKEYFENLEQMYKDDKDKYFEYQLEKASYDKGLADYNDKVKNEAEEKEEEERKKAVEAAKKAKEKLLKVEEDYRSKVEKITIGSYKEAVKEFEEEINALSEYYNGKVFDDTLLSTLERYKKEYKDIKTDMAAWFKSLNQDSSLEYNAGFGVYKWYNEGNRDDYKKFLQLSGEEMRNAIGKIFDDGENFYKNKLETEMFRIGKLNRAIINDAIDNGGKEANRKINDQILQIFEKNIRPKVSDEVAKLQNDIDKKTIKLDFEIETGFNGDEWIDNEELIPIKNFDKRTAELERATAIYQNALQQLLVQRKYYAETADYAELMGYTDSNEYEQAVIQIEAIDNQLNKVHADYFRTNAEIRDKYFAEDLNKIQTQENSELLLAQRHYNELFATESNFLNDVRILSGLRPGQEQTIADETFRIQKESLTRQLEAYQTYLSDVTVNGEQRVEAEKMVATLIAQIEDLELQHTVETNDKKIQSFMFYYSVVQDGVQQIGGLIGSLADYYETNAKALKDAGKITQEEYEEEFERIRGIKLAEAWINTISGSIGAFMQAVSTYPWPTGPIIGGIAAAATFASGMAQIAQIKAQKPDGSSSPSAMATPQTQVYEPSYVENPTNDNEVSNLRNAYMEQPIYVKVSDIDSAQEGRRVRTSESSF